MNPERLLQHFERISEAPDAIPRLRRFILDLAVRGKLVEQDPNDEPAVELLKRIQAEKARLVKEGRSRSKSPLTQSSLTEHSMSFPKLEMGKIGRDGYTATRGAGHPHKATRHTGTAAFIGQASRTLVGRQYT